MKLYKQKSKTSCLLAAAQCMVGKDQKEIFRQISKKGVRECFNKTGNDYYFKYSKFYTTLLKNNAICDYYDVFVDNSFPIDYPAVLGISFYRQNSDYKFYHAVYWDGNDKLWCPTQGEIKCSIYDLDIKYAFVKKEKIRYSTASMLEHFERIDKIISENSNKSVEYIYNPKSLKPTKDKTNYYFSYVYTTN